MNVFELCFKCYLHVFQLLCACKCHKPKLIVRIVKRLACIKGTSCIITHHIFTLVQNGTSSTCLDAQCFINYQNADGYSAMHTAVGEGMQG